MLKFINILGVKVTSDSEEKILEYTLQRLKKPGKKFFITTPNPEIVVYANSRLDYRDKLNEAEIALPDGAGILLGSKLLGQPLKSRITGVDFIEKLCLACKDKPISMGFLGGRGEVAERAVNRLKNKYPWINVGFVGEEWSFRRGPAAPHPHPTSSASLAGDLWGSPSRVTPSSIDLLFVAFGHPKQEEWIYENLEKLPVKAAMGVGGAFDYISGDVPRAPLFIRKIGFEWFFRLVRQPWRWKRQLSLVKFCYLVLKERFNNKDL